MPPDQIESLFNLFVMSSVYLAFGKSKRDRAAVLAAASSGVQPV